MVGTFLFLFLFFIYLIAEGIRLFLGVLLYEILQKISIKKVNVFKITSITILIISNKCFNWYLRGYIMCPVIIVSRVTFPQVRLKNTVIFSEITFQLYLWHIPFFYVFHFGWICIKLIL